MLHPILPTRSMHPYIKYQDMYDCDVDDETRHFFATGVISASDQRLHNTNCVTGAAHGKDVAWLCGSRTSTNTTTCCASEQRQGNHRPSSPRLNRRSPQPTRTPTQCRQLFRIQQDERHRTQCPCKPPARLLVALRRQPMTHTQQASPSCPRPTSLQEVFAALYDTSVPLHSRNHAS